MACLLLLVGAGALSGCLTGRAGTPRQVGRRATATAWFTEEAELRGLRVATQFEGTRPMNILQSAGAGVALLDHDSDGWLDVFVVGRKGFNPQGHGFLFRNRGDGTFEDRTRGSGLDAVGPWHGVAVGDYDNDGRPDLFLTGFGDSRLFRNSGSGKFRDVTRGSGLEARSPYEWNTAAAFGDVDLDGMLDLYVGRYVRFAPDDLQHCNYHGVKAACGPKSYDAQRGALYRNLGHGRFADVTASWGLGGQEGKTLGATFGDVNNDRFPDLYLANDEVPGHLYLNQSGAGFRESGVISGTSGGATGEVQGGMGVDWGDVDNDTQPDLFVTTFQLEDHSLYRNLGNAQFEHCSRAAGLGEITRAFVGFGARFLDVDRDGLLDIITANGHIQDNVAEIDTSTTYRQTLQLFHNVGGTRFDTTGGGAVFDRPVVGRGLATGDVDNDGDSDVVVTDLEGPPLLLINNAASEANWVTVRLIGRRSNRMGLGARVLLRSGGGTQVRECRTCGSYLSSHDARIMFGLGSATTANLEVRWPSGSVSRREGVAVNQILTIEEGA